MSELEREGGEDRPNATPVVEVPRTEKTGPQLPIRKRPLCKRLCDRQFPRPSQTVEPEHPFILFIVQPAAEMGADISPSTLHASFPITTEIPSVRDVIHAIQKGEVRSRG